MSIGYFQWTKIGCFRWTRSGSFRRTLTLRKKVQIGKVTLPITYGDTLALKVLGVIAIIFIVILGIGCLQGWLEWQS